jgi:hypothetical protein
MVLTPALILTFSPPLEKEQVSYGVFFGSVSDQSFVRQFKS